MVYYLYILTSIWYKYINQERRGTIPHARSKSVFVSPFPATIPFPSWETLSRQRVGNSTDEYHLKSGNERCGPGQIAKPDLGIAVKSLGWINKIASPLETC
jgi:hypothetical protein